MSKNLQKTDSSDAAMLGFSLSQASLADPHSLMDQHRENLRNRLVKKGLDGVSDLDLLELILFRALPRRDIRPLCKFLLRQFGTLNAVLTAPVNDLTQIKGIGTAVITELKLIEAAAHRLGQQQLIGKEVLTSWSQLILYCRARMAHLRVEQFRVLFLDSKNVLIADECLQKGIVNHVPVYPRQIAKRALELDAIAVILVHNHPSGDPAPSQSDIDVTLEVIDALQALRISVHDHVIIGQDGETSFRSAGLI